MHERTLIVYPDPRLLAQAVAARTLLTLNEVLGTPGRDRADIAVTGGTDGTAILESMASSALLDIVDWSRVHVWWGDERFVAADSDERNDRAARAALFDALIAEGVWAMHRSMRCPPTTAAPKRAPTPPHTMTARRSNTQPHVTSRNYCTSSARPPRWTS